MKPRVTVHSNSFVVRRGNGAETAFRSVQQAFDAKGERETVWVKTDGHGYFGPVVRP